MRSSGRSGRSRRGPGRPASRRAIRKKVSDDDWKPGLSAHRKFLSDRAWLRMLDLFADMGYGQELGRSFYRAGVRRDTVSLDLALSDRLAERGPAFTDTSNDRIDLERALEQIGPRAAALIQVIDREDVMQREVARALGMSETRVSQIRTVAFHELRPLLAA